MAGFHPEWPLGDKDPCISAAATGIFRLAWVATEAENANDNHQ